MNRIFSIFAFLFLLSCQTKEEEQHAEIIKHNAIKETQQDSVDVFIEPISLLPKEFKSYLNFLDSLGIKSDSILLKKVCCYSELKTGKVELIENYLLYWIDFKNHRVYNDSSSHNIPNEIPDTILGYYGYNKQLDADLSIEMFKFKDSVVAKSFNDHFIRNGLKWLYPNTYSDTKQSHNIVYLIHTRADRFYWTLKKAILQFKEI